MQWFLLGLGVNALVAYLGWKRLNAERGRQEVLSVLTSVTVWVSYLGYSSVTVAAATFGIWPVPIGVWVSLGLGSAAIGLGILLFVAGVISFGSFSRISGTVNEGLVTTGIYQWSRNPQNVGWMMFLLGTAIIGQSGLALLLTALFWIGFVLYVRQEERQLEARFDDEYRLYLRSSHRYYVPFCAVIHLMKIRTKHSSAWSNQAEANEQRRSVADKHRPSLARHRPEF